MGLVTEQWPCAGHHALAPNSPISILILGLAVEKDCVTNACQTPTRRVHQAGLDPAGEEQGAVESQPKVEHALRWVLSPPGPQSQTVSHPLTSC